MDHFTGYYIAIAMYVLAVLFIFINTEEIGTYYFGNRNGSKNDMEKS